MWDAILNVVLAVVAVVLTRYVIPAINVYLEIHKADGLTKDINDFVKAAEQLFPGAKTGDEKLAHVISLVERKGVEITDEVRAKIEAAVYDLG